MDIENLHIIDNNTIFYEGNKHYFIYQSNDGYTMAIEEIGKDGDMVQVKFKNTEKTLDYKLCIRNNIIEKI